MSNVHKTVSALIINIVILYHDTCTHKQKIAEYFRIFKNIDQGHTAQVVIIKLKGKFSCLLSRLVQVYYFLKPYRENQKCLKESTLFPIPFVIIYL